MRSFAKNIPFACLTAALLVSCGGGETEPTQPDPVGFVFVTPPADTFHDHTAFAPAPVLQLVDAEGSPVHQSGVSADMQASPAGLVMPGCDINFPRVTDAQGIVVFGGCRISGRSGGYTLKFTPAGFPVLSHPVLLLSGAAANLTSSTPPAKVRVGTLVPAVVVWLADSSGNHIPGASLGLAVSAGGGSVTGTIVSGVSGAAFIGDWKVDTLAGINALTVTATGVAVVAPLHLQVAGEAGPPTSITIDSTWTGPLPVDTVLTNAITVKATDAYGNPTAGLLATFHIWSDPAHDGGYVMPGGQFPMDGTGTATLPVLHTEKRAGRYEFLVGLGVGTTGWNVFGGYTLLPGAPVQISGVLGTTRGPVGVPHIAAIYVGDKAGNPIAIPLVVNVTQGNGSVIADSTLYPNEIYQAIHWTFGTAGPQQIVVSTPAIPDATVTLNAVAVAPIAIIVTAGAGQTGPVGAFLPIQPVFRVVDSAGAGVDSVPVKVNGGGAGEGNYASDVDGYVHVGNAQFTGPPGPTQLSANSTWVPGDTALIGLNSTVGPPSGIDPITLKSVVVAGSSTDSVATLKVHDLSGYAVSGVIVHFSVTSGSFTLDSAVSDPAGIILIPTWTAGTIAGNATITASVGPLHRDLILQIDPGPVASLAFADGFQAAGFAGEVLSVPARLIAKDQYGNNATSAAGGTLSVLSGGGTASGLTYIGAGVLRPTQWALGPLPGINELQVAFGAVTLTVSVDAPAPSPFNITLRGVPEALASEFGHAAFEWRRRISADIPDLTNVTIPAGTCTTYQPTVSGDIDDLIIDVRIGPIDGAGGILGGAFPCYIRTIGKLPLLGDMEFDDADIAQLRVDGTLGDVILHEMGHVLGIGSLWTTFGLVNHPMTPNPLYVGAGGKQGWFEIGGGATDTSSAPVENTGGAGTRDVHWREISMPSELMTGYLSALVNPMSLVTIRSLGDLGYSVDPSTADPYTAFTAPMPAPGQRGVRIQDRVTGPRFTVDANGKIKPIE